MSRRGGGEGEDKGDCFSPRAACIQPPPSHHPRCAIFFASIKRRPREVVVFKWRVEKNVLRPQPSFPPAIVLPFRPCSSSRSRVKEKEKEREKKKKERKENRFVRRLPLTTRFPCFLFQASLLEINSSAVITDYCPAKLRSCGIITRPSSVVKLIPLEREGRRGGAPPIR